MPRLPFALIVSVLALSAAALRSQCQTQWTTDNPLPGTNGTVNVLGKWDPDGPGPAGELVVVGGGVTIAGAAACPHIAVHDPGAGTWSALGTGLNGAVYAVQGLPNGDLVVGGEFTMAGGLPASHIARWSGSSWSALGPGFDGTVHALTVLANGDVIAGGAFARAGATVVNGIAKWNGSSWSNLGSGMFAFAPAVATVRALGTFANGDVAAAA